MQSPLEHDVELITLLGLVTVRWSALEDALADVLGALMKADDVGHQMIYAMSSFSQRLDLVRAAVKASLVDNRQIIITDKLFEKVAGLWTARNNFAHAHYVHRTEYRDGMVVTLVKEDGLGLRREAIDDSGEGVKSRNFGYIKYGKGGMQKFVPVNRGSIMNHARVVIRRGRQLALLSKSIETGVLSLRKPGVVSHLRVSPRSPHFDGIVRPLTAHTMRGPETT